MTRRSILGLAACLAGCGLSERPYVERHEWPLTVARRMVSPPPPHGPILRVDAVSAGPGTRERGLQLLQPDGSVQIGFYDEWAVPPADSMTEVLRAWLAGSGLFAAVLGPDSDAAADLVLQGDLTRFACDSVSRQARIDMTIVLLTTAGIGSNVLAQHALSAVAPLANTDAAAIVSGLRDATETLLGKVEVTLASLVPRTGLAITRRPS